MKTNQTTTAMPMTVTEDLTVTITPNHDHEFLMSTKEVSHGYDVSEYAVRQTFCRHNDELIEGKHFVKGVTISHTLPNAQPNQMFWTKRGIVRLGFFIKSNRAKLFRDWAEDLIIKVDELQKQGTLFDVAPIREIPQKQKYYNNRLTMERLNGVLITISKIKEAEIREELIAQLVV